MDKLYEAIKQETDIRANLIALRQRLKQPGEAEKLREYLRRDDICFEKLLEHEDPKVRKNAALLIGDLKEQKWLDALYQAYRKEETLFIRSDYLKAMEKLDFSAYQPRLKERLEQMAELEVSEENQKHHREELLALQKMVLQHQPKRKHKFKGLDQKYDIILTTNRNYREITAQQIRGKKVALVPLGVKVREAELNRIFEIRTFRELFFVMDVQTVGADPREAAGELAASNLLDILERAHGISEAFYFRITVAGKMPLDKRSTFIKKCSFELEQRTGRRLLNTASDYEIELKLFERRDGTFLPLLKLHTLKDERFAYRKESIAASIHPSSAALIAALAKPYLKEHGQVLDPFCGVGTMLIERDKAMRAGTMYGIDVFGEAIVKARENANLARRDIYYIHRDFFDFTHEYFFDEIFTNMPVRGKKTREEQEAFYRRFFEKAQEVLKRDGIMVLYSNEKGYVKKQIRLNERWKLLNEYCMDEREEFSIYIIGRRG